MKQKTETNHRVTSVIILPVFYSQHHFSLLWSVENWTSCNPHPHYRWTDCYQDILVWVIGKTKQRKKGK